MTISLDVKPHLEKIRSKLPKVIQSPPPRAILFLQGVIALSLFCGLIFGIYTIHSIPGKRLRLKHSEEVRILKQNLTQCRHVLQRMTSHSSHIDAYVYGWQLSYDSIPNSKSISYNRLPRDTCRARLTTEFDNSFEREELLEQRIARLQRELRLAREARVAADTEAVQWKETAQERLNSDYKSDPDKAGHLFGEMKTLVEAHAQLKANSSKLANHLTSSLAEIANLKIIINRQKSVMRRLEADSETAKAEAKAIRTFFEEARSVTAQFDPQLERQIRAIINGTSEMELEEMEKETAAAAKRKLLKQPWYMTLWYYLVGGVLTFIGLVLFTSILLVSAVLFDEKIRVKAPWLGFILNQLLILADKHDLRKSIVKKDSLSSSSPPSSRFPSFSSSSSSSSSSSLPALSTMTSSFSNPDSNSMQPNYESNFKSEPHNPNNTGTTTTSPFSPHEGYDHQELMESSPLKSDIQKLDNEESANTFSIESLSSDSSSSPNPYPSITTFTTQQNSNESRLSLSVSTTNPISSSTSISSPTESVSSSSSLPVSVSASTSDEDIVATNCITDNPKSSSNPPSQGLSPTRNHSNPSKRLSMFASRTSTMTKTLSESKRPLSLGENTSRIRSLTELQQAVDAEIKKKKEEANSNFNKESLTQRRLSHDKENISEN